MSAKTKAARVQFFKVHTTRESPGDAGLGEFAEPQEAAVPDCRLLAEESYRKRCERAARRERPAPESRGRTYTVLVRRPGHVARCFRVKLDGGFNGVESSEVQR